MRKKIRTVMRLVEKRRHRDKVHEGGTQFREGFFPSYDTFRTAFGDQKAQVGFLLNYIFNYEANGLKRGGYFVDLAAADGMLHSNTYFLESILGWKGLLIEANPAYAESLKRNRSSQVVQACVSDRNDEEVKFRIDNGFLGGIIDDETDNNRFVRARELSKAQILTLPSKTLEQILIERNSPKLIDFVSLDVEGAEYMILRNFNFENYQFRSIVVERPSAQLDALLDEKGYVQLAHMHQDVFYCHRDFLDEVNLEPKIIFSLTQRKDW